MLIQDIGELVVVPRGPLAGAQMSAPGRIRNAALQVREGQISWFGRADEAPDDEQRRSAEGGLVVPGLIDPHTHIPFAGERSGEFERRLAGESYLSIMQAGGGIRVTTQAVRASSEQDLIDLNLPRLQRMLTYGVTTCECKSGYGLTVEDELRQLRAIRALKGLQPIELVATYLGAHALPAEYEGRADEFIDMISASGVLQQIVDEELAEFCDVFCDAGAFDVPQSRRVLQRAAAAGLRLKLHADELEQIGATRLAGELGAISADHLETIDEGGIAALKRAGTIAVVLPGTSFFLGIEHCNTRGLIEAGLPVALSTDYNPGSSHIENLQMILNIACCQLRLTPTEVLVAVTANAAAAIGRAHRLGAIAPGYQADLLVLDAGSLADWFYAPGRDRVQCVLKAGQVVHGNLA